jgi:hypothetical protein
MAFVQMTIRRAREVPDSRRMMDKIMVMNIDGMAMKR